MPDNPEWDFLKALWEGIKEGFRKSKVKGGRPAPSQGLSSRVGNSIIIVLCLALLIGGTFAGVALTWASRASRVGHGHSSVTTFFLTGAGLGTVVGLVYVIRCWLRDDDL